MKNVTKFSEQLDVILERVSALERGLVSPSPQHDKLLSEALDGLSLALEELRVTEEELREQNKALLDAHDALDAERRRYQDLFEFAPDGYVVTDMDGIIQEANHAAVKMFGISAQFLSGKPLVMLLDESAHHLFFTELNHIRLETRTKTVGVRLQTRQGVSIDALLTVAAIQDYHGNLTGLRWLLHDVTERKKAERQIQNLNVEFQRRVAEGVAQFEAEQQLRDVAFQAEKRSALLISLSALLAASFEDQKILPGVVDLLIPKFADCCIVYEVDQDAKIQTWAAKYTDPVEDSARRSLEAVSASGQNTPELQHWLATLKRFHQDRPKLMSNLTEIIEKSNPDEVKYLQPFQQCGLAALFTAPLVARRQVLGTLILGIDGSQHSQSLLNMTLVEGIAHRIAQALDNARLYAAESRARRAAEHANELKLKFVAMVSHELRTPLTSIKGFASTLLATDVTWDAETQRDFISTIDEEADKLTELIDQLLDLSRLQAGTLRIRPEPHSLSRIIDSSMAQLKFLAIAHELIIDIPSDLPLIMVDRHRIAQVITNLVDNAAKYSAEGTQITISAAVRDRMLQVNISDEGPGIPSEDRERVFEAFQRLEKHSSLHNTKGVGLGLAICKGLIEAHSGRIWITDQPQKGTTISFVVLIVAGNTEIAS